ncbi:haloacid dehalogenase type II [Bradyrhizobium japonicum]|uniref:haloacid dehalogenase type II n=1 Tax=Bradyrhizobium japonicum TaxID=375 RepID=UPI001BA7A9D4|nr:haloacid dehalogenase type II [Bradyrhizobium japonicum]MBR0745749.1 haloacid dehalogenase type II [Bradyrhizobium japonicum]
MNAERDDTGTGFVSRRSIVGITAAAAVLPTSMLIEPIQAATAAPSDPIGIKAMTFDIQGTLFDYYQPFARISSALNKRNARRLNWSGFLGDWNAGAVSIIQAIITGTRKWIPPGQVFRESLEAALSMRDLTSQLDETDRLELMSVWSQMVPWPDSALGVGRLKRKVTVAALSNAGMAGVIALAKRGGLPFDAVLTGELVHSYKPSPDVYQAASTYLGFPPGKIMMVAAHKFDLKGAKAAGFKTAYIPRPLETGPATKVDRSPEPYIDVIANDLMDLSRMIDLG